MVSFYSKYSGSEIESVLDSVPNKQEMLIEGKGINIDDNVISCTLDTTLYKVVQNLPETGEENKIYLIQSNGGGAQNIYQEYAFVDNEWEILGEYRAEVNLEPYLSKEDAEELYQPKGNYITVENLPKEILMMRAYIFDFSGTYTKAEVESNLRVSFADLISAIKSGNGIVLTSSSASDGNYNFILGATYTLLSDNETVNEMTLTWIQYGQWTSLSIVYNQASDNYTVTVTKTTM